MSRIGKKFIGLPKGVEVAALGEGKIKVKGPKGELHLLVHPTLTVEVDSENIKVTRPGDDRISKSQHGLARSLINNAVIGVTTGFKKSLQIIGVGYRAAAQGEGLQLQLGYSHPLDVAAVPGIKFEVVVDPKAKTNFIHIHGMDKQRVGQVAAELRELRPPEPYKGKGVRYVDEIVQRKMGKAGKAK